MTAQKKIPVTIFTLKVKCSNCQIGTPNLFNSTLNNLVYITILEDFTLFLYLLVLQQRA